MKRRQFNKLYRFLKCTSLEIVYRLDQIVERLTTKAVSTEIVLGKPSIDSPTSQRSSNMARHKLNRAKGVHKAGGPNITLPQLASDGAVLVALDAGKNVVTGGIDPTKTTVDWSTSDSTVITVSVDDPMDTTKATLKSTGKVGSNITVTATLTNLDGSTPLPPAVSDGIDVPAGPAITASIVLGVPS